MDKFVKPNQQPLQDRKDAKDYGKEKEKEKKEEKKKPPEKQEETGELDDIFAIEDPIDTILGPIGRFKAVPESFPMHPTVALYGKRRTGKSFTLRWIMYHCFRHVPFGKSFASLYGYG